MACGHGKLWWKGAGRLGMREGCREARDTGPGPQRGLVRLSHRRLIDNLESCNCQC